LVSRIEEAIQKNLCSSSLTGKFPEGLRSAIEYSVFPGGARIRPTILISVAKACGDDMPEITDAAASALEMIHCASLVHDDLPCFDNTAVLAGDSLIINAFKCLASVSKYSHTRCANLTLSLSKYAGFPNGICAGQGWESESHIDLKSYHMSKTGALFIAATQMGAASAGHDPEPWFELGARIGEAFQVADDLIDVISDDVNSGKNVGQDEKNNRPNAIREFGVEGAKRHLQDILAGAISSIPSCPGEGELAQLVKMQATRMLEINDSKIIV